MWAYVALEYKKTLRRSGKCSSGNKSYHFAPSRALKGYIFYYIQRMCSSFVHKSAEYM